VLEGLSATNLLYYFFYFTALYINSVQVAKIHLSFATALLWYLSFEITLKLYLYGKYSTQTMIFWSLCAFIWFRNMKKMLLQMTSASLQPVPSLPFYK
jgi:hypothetical protein